jgi:hypothetical protein
MQSMIVGLRVPLIWAKRASLSLAGDLGAVRIASRTLDATDVKRLSAWRFMYRREFGLEGRVRPRAAKPWSINAGYAIGSVQPVVQSGIVDGYTPFDQPLLTRRAWLGIMVAIDPATGQRRRR